ncbi:MAG TPA: divalent cation tolerance protein CutA [Candidatus Babeliales bacterium]|nr:divalent cation tolerance protein CutA [Candidatus Babeliales bacterium]
MNELILFNVSFPDQETAHQAAYMLLEKKLIASAHVRPHESIYSWEGKLNHDQEYTLSANTEKSFISEIEQEIKALHPHKIPGIYYFPIQAEHNYAKYTTDLLKTNSGE